jgi:glutamine synthetase
MFVFIFFADMAAPSLATPALGCMQEIQRQCFLLGIPLKTRHREVAPNQFEFAPLYGFVTTQIDQNLMVMQIIEETAASFGLAALFQEKPFQVSVHLVKWLLRVFLMSQL